MAEALLRRRLEGAGVEATVHSAGLFIPGLPADRHIARAMAERGYDLADHRSQRLTAGLIGGADVVIGLAREHVREAVLLCPEAWPRCTTLKELVRRAGAVGPRRGDQGFGEWLGQVLAGRRREDLLGSSADDDVADPYGLGLASSQDTAVELDDLVSRLVALGWAHESRGDAA